MADIEIWHNPDCSKSRATLALLEGRVGAERLAIVRYRELPPSAARLRTVLELLGTDAASFIRRSEPLFDALGLDGADEGSLVDAMCLHPELIERPVVISDRGARIGRPPERVLEIL